MSSSITTFSKSLTSKLRAARQLSNADWLTLAEAWWVLWGSSLALRWMRFETLTVPLDLTLGEDPYLPEKVASAQRLRRLLALASRGHFLPMTCLARALALRRMLQKRGIPSQVRIGAAKSFNRFYAHAWVEVQGQAIGEHEDIPERFAVFESAM